MYIYKTLSNGIRVVADKIDYLRSVSVGVWVGNGSRYEKAEENGISHFIEHMVFKGSSKRTAAQIADAIDSVGGQINAFTAREYTCFYTKTLDEHSELAMDVLSDMIFAPMLDPRDMELEKNVVYEEISIDEDDTEELVYDHYCAAVWKDTPMGRPVLGTRDTLAKMTPDTLRAYMRSHYTTKNIVISAAGNFGDDFFDMLEKYFGGYDVSIDAPEMPAAEFKQGSVWHRKDVEQAQLIMGFRGIDSMDEAAYSLLVFNNVFGCGISSRLFQTIREREGLVYSVSSGHSAYIGTGSFDIEAGMNPSNLGRVCELIMKEVRRIKAEKLTYDEVARSKEMLKGNYILSSESTGERMQSTGRSLLLGKPVYTQEDVLRKIESVSIDSVAEIIDRVTDEKTLSWAVVSPEDCSNVTDLVKIQ